MKNVTKINLDNIDREDLEFGIEATKQILKEYEAILQQVMEQEAQKEELDAEAGVEVPDDYVYVLADNDNLQIHIIGEDICFECAEDLSRLGLIRADSESAWVSARRNIRANRLEALAHMIGGAYEFDADARNYYIYFNNKGKACTWYSPDMVEPDKVYMSQETAEQVCKILNSGRYKLNVDVAVEDDEFCEECCCDACAGNDC